jgi:hypothetical protein
VNDKPSHLHSPRMLLLLTAAFALVFGLLGSTPIAANAASDDNDTSSAADDTTESSGGDSSSGDDDGGGDGKKSSKSGDVDPQAVTSKTRAYDTNYYEDEITQREGQDPVHWVVEGDPDGNNPVTLQGDLTGGGHVYNGGLVTSGDAFTPEWTTDGTNWVGTEPADKTTVKGVRASGTWTDEEVPGTLENENGKTIPEPREIPEVNDKGNGDGFNVAFTGQKALWWNHNKANGKPLGCVQKFVVNEETNTPKKCKGWNTRKTGISFTAGVPITSGSNDDFVAGFSPQPLLYKGKLFIAGVKISSLNSSNPGMAEVVALCADLEKKVSCGSLDLGMKVWSTGYDDDANEWTSQGGSGVSVRPALATFGEAVTVGGSPKMLGRTFDAMVNNSNCTYAKSQGLGKNGNGCPQGWDGGNQNRIQQNGDRTICVNLDTFTECGSRHNQPMTNTRGAFPYSPFGSGQEYMVGESSGTQVFKDSNSGSYVTVYERGFNARTDGTTSSPIGCYDWTANSNSGGVCANFSHSGDGGTTVAQTGAVTSSSPAVAPKYWRAKINRFVYPGKVDALPGSKVGDEQVLTTNGACLLGNYNPKGQADTDDRVFGAVEIRCFNFSTGNTASSIQDELRGSKPTAGECSATNGESIMGWMSNNVFLNNGEVSMIMPWWCNAAKDGDFKGNQNFDSGTTRNKCVNLQNPGSGNCSLGQLSSWNGNNFPRNNLNEEGDGEYAQIYATSTDPYYRDCVWFNSNNGLIRTFSSQTGSPKCANSTGERYEPGNADGGFEMTAPVADQCLAGSSKYGNLTTTGLTAGQVYVSVTDKNGEAIAGYQEMDAGDAGAGTPTLDLSGIDVGSNVTINGETYDTTKIGISFSIAGTNEDDWANGKQPTVQISTLVTEASMCFESINVTKCNAEPEGLPGTVNGAVNTIASTWTVQFLPEDVCTMEVKKIRIDGPDGAEVNDKDNPLYPGDTAYYRVTMTNTAPPGWPQHGRFIDDMSDTQKIMTYQDDAVIKQGPVGSLTFDAEKSTLTYRSWDGPSPAEIQPGASVVVEYTQVVKDRDDWTNNGVDAVKNVVTTEECQENDCTPIIPPTNCEEELNPQDNPDCNEVVLPPPPPTLTVVKEQTSHPGDKPVLPGEKVEYKVTITNPSTSKEAAWARFYDDLSGTFTIMEEPKNIAIASGPTGEVSYTSPLLTYTSFGGPSPAKLKPGESAVVTYSQKVKWREDWTGDSAKNVVSTEKCLDPKDPACNGTVIPPTNCEEELNPQDNPDCNAVIIPPPPPEAVVKKEIIDPNGNPSPGDTVRYKITMKNPKESLEPIRGIWVDDLTDVLDDAKYNNDAEVTKGPGKTFWDKPYLSYDSIRGNNPGLLKPGQEAVVKYSITVNDPSADKKKAAAKKEKAKTASKKQAKKLKKQAKKLEKRAANAFGNGTLYNKVYVPPCDPNDPECPDPWCPPADSGERCPPPPPSNCPPGSEDPRCSAERPVKLPSEKPKIPGGPNEKPLKKNCKKDKAKKIATIVAAEPKAAVRVEIKECKVGGRKMTDPNACGKAYAKPKKTNRENEADIYAQAYVAGKGYMTVGVQVREKGMEWSKTKKIKVKLTGKKGQIDFCSLVGTG